MTITSRPELGKFSRWLSPGQSRTKQSVTPLKCSTTAISQLIKLISLPTEWLLLICIFTTVMGRWPLPFNRMIRNCWTEGYLLHTKKHPNLSMRSKVIIIVIIINWWALTRNSSYFESMPWAVLCSPVLQENLPSSGHNYALNDVSDLLRLLCIFSAPSWHVRRAGSWPSCPLFSKIFTITSVSLDSSWELHLPARLS